MPSSRSLIYLILRPYGTSQDGSGRETGSRLVSLGEPWWKARVVKYYSASKAGFATLVLGGNLVDYPLLLGSV